MVITPYTPIVGFKPLTQITPFTYRDGATFVEVLNRFEGWLKDVGVDLENSLNDYVAEMNGIKGSWQDLFDKFMADVVAQLEALNDTAVSNLVNTESSKLRNALDSIFVDHGELESAIQDAKDFASSEVSRRAVLKNELVFNVKDFGAKGDGVTLDTAAVQSAVDGAGVNGGVVYFPPGTYKIVNVTLRSNITLTGEGVITSTTYNVFRGLSGDRRGYGASVSNVSFIGLTFKGDFNKSDNAVAVTLHHAENIIFDRCVWDEAILGGHAIDLAACRNVTISNTVFRGFNPPAGREYAEAIQIDHSTYQGISGMDLPGSYDGLPCVNVKVSGCSFVPLQRGATTYYAPNPIGSHATLTDNHKKIIFENNIIENHFPSQSFSSITSPVHFQGVEDLTISGNRFTGDGVASSVIKILNFTTGIAPGDVAASNPSNSSALTNKASRNINILNNYFEGYRSLENKGLVIVSGSSNNALRPDAVNISENQFIDCAPNQTGNVGSNPIAVSNCDRVKVSGNVARGVRSLLYASGIWGIAVTENIVDDARWVAIAIDGLADKEMVNSTIANNVFTGCGSTIYLNYGHGSSIIGNLISDAKAGHAFAGYADGNITVANSRAVILSGNIVRATDPVNGTGAIQFLRSCTVSQAVNNITRGWTQGVHASADSTVTMTGNMN